MTVRTYDFQGKTHETNPKLLFLARGVAIYSGSESFGTDTYQLIKNFSYFQCRLSLINCGRLQLVPKLEHHFTVFCLVDTVTFPSGDSDYRNHLHNFHGLLKIQNSRT